MGVKLSDLVISLKNELRAAVDAESGDQMFSLKSACIKTRVAVVDKRTTSGGIEVYVASADLEKGTETASEHEIMIELGPLKPILMGNDPD